MENELCPPIVGTRGVSGRGVLVMSVDHPTGKSTRPAFRKTWPASKQITLLWGATFKSSNRGNLPHSMTRLIFTFGNVSGLGNFRLWVFLN